jgi:hypothetical protein
MSSDPANEPEAEIALLRRVAQGDQQGFAELYDRFSGVLFSTALRVLNNQEAAEDVLQDVFLQIWEKAPLYDPSRGKPMTWAVTMTRQTPSLPGTDPRSDRFRCGGRESKFLAASQPDSPRPATCR